MKKFNVYNINNNELIISLLGESGEQAIEQLQKLINIIIFNPISYLDINGEYRISVTYDESPIKRFSDDMLEIYKKHKNDAIFVYHETDTFGRILNGDDGTWIYILEDMEYEINKLPTEEEYNK